METARPRSQPMGRPKLTAPKGRTISVQLPAEDHAKFMALVGKLDTSRRALAAKYIVAGITRDTKNQN